MCKWRATATPSARARAAKRQEIKIGKKKLAENNKSRFDASILNVCNVRAHVVGWHARAHATDRRSNCFNLVARAGRRRLNPMCTACNMNILLFEFRRSARALSLCALKCCERSLVGRARARARTRRRCLDRERWRRPLVCSFFRASQLFARRPHDAICTAAAATAAVA